MHQERSRKRILESGPQILLAYGKGPPLNKLKYLHRVGAPKGSKVVMTLNTYMKDEAWAEAAPSIAQRIHDMLVVKEDGDMSAVSQAYDKNTAKCDKGSS